MVVGEDYRDYVDHFRAGTTRPYQAHGQVFMREVAEETGFSRFTILVAAKPWRCAERHTDRVTCGTASLARLVVCLGTEKTTKEAESNV